LNLGWIGVCLIAFILVTGYARAFAAFRRNPHIGGLMLAYVIASAIYSITEAGFRMMDPIWIFLLLAVVGASGVAVARVRSQPRKVRIPWDDTSAERPSGAGLIPQTENL
jgi:O-antigen ligase